MLRAMVETGSISAAEAAAAQAERLALLPPAEPDNSIAPHVIDYFGWEQDIDQIDDDENPRL